MLIQALQIIAAFGCGVLGANISLAVKNGAAVWLPAIFGVGAIASWAWMAKYWPGSILTASLVWNIAHDFGEYGMLALVTKPTFLQLLGVVLVIAGLMIVTYFGAENG